MTAYEINLADDLRASLKECLRLLDHQGKPVPLLKDMDKIRKEAALAVMNANELYGVMNARNRP